MLPILGMALMILVSSQSSVAGDFRKAEPHCGIDDLTINTGLSSSTGIIELLVPLPDTDGAAPFYFAAEENVCIPFDRMVGWYNDLGMGPNEFGLRVTYDPEGQGESVRSQASYDILMCGELADTPKPPRDLKIGEFDWSPQSGVTAVRVSWIKDFRKRLEDDCAANL